MGFIPFTTVTLSTVAVTLCNVAAVTAVTVSTVAVTLCIVAAVTAVTVSTVAVTLCYVAAVTTGCNTLQSGSSYQRYCLHLTG